MEKIKTMKNIKVIDRSLKQLDLAAKSLLLRIEIGNIKDEDVFSELKDILYFAKKLELILTNYETKTIKV